MTWKLVLFSIPCNMHFQRLKLKNSHRLQECSFGWFFIKFRSVFLRIRKFPYIYIYINLHMYIYIYRVSQEEWPKLRESVPYVKMYRYNPKHLCPKLNGYGDNGQRKVLTSCISAYCTPSAVSALTLTEQCSRHLCECTSSAQHDKIILHYCQIFMRYVQCLVTLRTTMTWVRVFL